MPYKMVKSRPTIGLFIDWTETIYHVDLISGVQDKAHENKINLINFIGGCINSPRIWEVPRNIIYKFVNENTLDGLIISSGSVGHYSTTEQIIEFINNYRSFPVVSISQLIPNIPSILVDNTIGLRNMILHLLNDHNYKNIAMITGPKGNQDSEQRYRIYCETLKSYGYKIDKNLIEQGAFILRSGSDAIHKLHKKNIPFDAVFAANDDMAMGAMQALGELGYLIPGDCAIVGFDDTTLSKYSHPPLTTVRQPIYEQGSKAVELIISLIAEKKVPLEIYLPTKLIIRESCGCLPESITQLSVLKKCEHQAENIENIGLQNKAFTNEIIKKIEIPEHFYNRISHSEIEELLDAFLTSFNRNDPKIFLNILSNILKKTMTTYEDELFWHNLITEIRKKYLPYIKKQKKVDIAEDLWHSARIKISNYIKQSYSFYRAIALEETQNFRDISEELVSILNIDDILSLLTRELSNIGIQTFILSLYEKEDSDESLHISSARLTYLFEGGQEIRQDYKNKVYQIEKLLPKGLLSEEKTYSFFLEPIFFRNYQLGIAFFEIGEKKSFIYNTIRKMFINSALKTSIYVKQVQIHSLNLEAQVSARTEALSKANKLLTKLYQDRKEAENQVRLLNEELEKRVYERTSQLESANIKLKNTLKTLRSTQDKLVQSEKMASLGSLVAGIAHEINTPLGIGVTAASHLDIITRELVERYANNTLKKSDLEKYISTTETAAQMVITNLKRAYELIKSFKNIAVDQSSNIRRKFNIKEYINEILLSLRPQLKKTTHKITVDCPDNIVMNSYPGPFSQIVTNLVMNSLIHAYEKKENGNITFKITTENNSLIFTYSDDGNGIPASHLKKIYDPFFTTKRNKGGTGLGLHLLYNIVTQTFKGSINCKSKIGFGTAFTIIFPNSI